MKLVVPDRLFSDNRLAELYDLFFETWHDTDFYLTLVLSAGAVLDIGCGTGTLLRRAREAGHKGRLCGLDPAPGMINQARKRADIEWLLGDLSSVRWNHEFDLAVMTGHAFQVFTTDGEIAASLAAIRSALTGGGRFAFETRNPCVKAWERWTPDQVREVTTPAGVVVWMQRIVDSVESDLVRFHHTFTSPAWDHPETSRSALRLLDAPSLASFLSRAGFVIDAQYGDWDRSPLTPASPEIITVARPLAAAQAAD